MAKGRNLASLTGIRFFAAFWVLVYHQSTPGGLLEHFFNSAPRFLFNMARTGPTAVGLFFVLSGFILAYNYDRGPLDKREFWWARVARIYPVYLLGLLLVAPAICAKVALHQAPIRELFYGLASLFLVQAWHPTAALAWNSPGWSLSAEAFFYLLFPFLLIPIDRLRRRGLLVAMAATWAVILLVPALCLALHVGDFRGVAAIDLPTGSWCNIVKFNPLIRLPEFVLGMMLGRLYLQRPANELERANGWIWSVPGALAFVVACATLTPYIPYPFFHNNAFVICFAMMIYGLACGGGVLDRFLSHSWMVKLGQASYAIYILHAPIDDWVIRADKKVFHLASRHPTALFALYALAVIFISIFVFDWIEEPARRFLRDRFTPIHKPQLQRSSSARLAPIN